MGGCEWQLADRGGYSAPGQLPKRSGAASEEASWGCTQVCHFCDVPCSRSTVERSLQRRWQAGRWTGDGCESASGPGASVSTSEAIIERGVPRESTASKASLFLAASPCGSARCGEGDVVLGPLQRTVNSSLGIFGQLAVEPCYASRTLLFIIISPRSQYCHDTPPVSASDSFVLIHLEKSGV